MSTDVREQGAGTTGDKDNPQQWQQAIANTLENLNDAIDTYTRTTAATKRWNYIKRTALTLLVTGVVLFYVLVYGRAFGLQSDPSKDAIALIPIQGTIAPGLEASADRVVPIIERACKAKRVSAIVLDINSGGGAPTESERINAALDQCRKTSKADGHEKEIYALINGVGASAAYMIAMKADRVYAGRYSIVGSVGAIMRLNDASELAARIGLREVSFKTAPLKGGPSMISGVTDGDAEAMQTLVQDMGQVFLAEVIAARGDKLAMDTAEIYSGRVWTSEQAMQAGLIDEIAVLEDLKDTIFKDLKVHHYKTKKSLVEGMGLKTVIHQVITELQTPTVQ